MSTTGTEHRAWLIIQIIYNKLLTAPLPLFPHIHCTRSLRKISTFHCVLRLRAQILTEVCRERALNTCHLVNMIYSENIFKHQIFSSSSSNNYTDELNKYSWFPRFHSRLWLRRVLAVPDLGPAPDSKLHL